MGPRKFSPYSRQDCQKTLISDIKCVVVGILTIVFYHILVVRIVHYQNKVPDNEIVKIPTTTDFQLKIKAFWQVWPGLPYIRSLLYLHANLPTGAFKSIIVGVFWLAPDLGLFGKRRFQLALIINSSFSQVVSHLCGTAPVWPRCVLLLRCRCVYLPVLHLCFVFKRV